MSGQVAGAILIDEGYRWQLDADRQGGFIAPEQRRLQGRALVREGRRLVGIKNKVRATKTR